VNDVVVGLKQGRGAAGMLLQDPALATQIRQTMTNVQQASADLGQVSSKANGLITDVQSRNFPQKIDETMTVVKSAASNVDATTQQIRQTIAEASIPDENGATPGMNIRESLSNTSTATANVADGTEALSTTSFCAIFSFIVAITTSGTLPRTNTGKIISLRDRKTTASGSRAPISFNKTAAAAKISLLMERR